jgi:hypothetical protein
MKISLTRVLAELKLLEKKIDQATATQFIGLYQKRNNAIIGTTASREDFEKNVKAEFQSLTDLITRSEKLRTALANANAANMVKIGEKYYSLAEAIVYKERILPIKQNLAKSLNAAIVKTAKNMEVNRVDLESRIEAMLTQNLGSDKKADKDAYDNIANPFIEANKLHMSDPANIVKYYETLKAEIELFTSEIDISLAEANSKIEIEIK